MIKNNQRGFSPVEVIIALLVVVIIGFLGWRLWQVQQDLNSLKKENSKSTTSSSKKSSTKTVSVDDKELVAKAVCTDGDSDVIELAKKSVEISNDIYSYYGGSCEAPNVEGIGPGANYFLKKTNGTWETITAGNGDLDCQKLEDEGFPQTMINQCQGPAFDQ